MRKFLVAGVWVLTFLVALLFLASCVVTLSDAQGALVFVFSLPIMGGLLLIAWLLARKAEGYPGASRRLARVPRYFGYFLGAFLVTALIPGVQLLPAAFMGGVGAAFTQVVGATPYAFFKERASFPNKLKNALAENKRVAFSELGVTFAWDTVCVFGPYTNEQKAKEILKMDWNIEERSQIYHSDSINALVFLYQGKVNQVVDLSRGLADFQRVDLCLPRPQASFELELDADGRKVLRLKP